MGRKSASRLTFNQHLASSTNSLGCGCTFRRIIRQYLQQVILRNADCREDERGKRCGVVEMETPPRKKKKKRKKKEKRSGRWCRDSRVRIGKDKVVYTCNVQ